MARESTSTYIEDNEKKMTNPEKLQIHSTTTLQILGKNLLQPDITTKLQHIHTIYKIPSAFSCIFRHITEEETITIIDKMVNKSSSGYDGIDQYVVFELIVLFCI